jgi:hypothetical protein
MLEEYIVKLNDKNGMFYQKIKISDNIETEKETGYLYCKNSILGHIGVQAYNGFEVEMPDKKVVYVRRNAEDVFDEDSLASIEGKPVTLNHPDEMVTSKNFKKYTVGFVKNVRQDGDNIVGDLVLNDMDAIEKVLSGELKDLSLGYTAKLVPTHDGELVQKNIVANHVAIVGEGRAKNARIVDEKTVDEGSEDMALFKKNKDVQEDVLIQDAEDTKIEDAKHVTKTTFVAQTTEEYDDETGEQKEVRSTNEIRTRSVEKENKMSDEKTKEENTVENTDKEEGEVEIMKDFSYYLAKYNEVKSLPKSEFRDAAFTALSTECKETLGVDLPEIVEVKINALDSTVGLADNLTIKENEEQPKKVPTIVYAKDEERMLANMYRKMDNPKYARQLSETTYHDVIEMFETKKGGII